MSTPAEIKCPHCGVEQPGLRWECISDANYDGVTYWGIEQCCECDKEFTVACSVDVYLDVHDVTAEERKSSEASDAALEASAGSGEPSA